MLSESTFDHALELAKRVGTKYGGAADLAVKWHPYECKWVASASWSDGVSMSESGDTVTDAMTNLMSVLSVVPLPSHSGANS